MFNQFYIVDNQICEAVIAVYRTKDPSGEFHFSLYFTLTLFWPRFIEFDLSLSRRALTWFLEIPKKELKSEACEDLNELGYSSILEKEIKGT